MKPSLSSPTGHVRVRNALVGFWLAADTTGVGGDADGADIGDSWNVSCWHHDFDASVWLSFGVTPHCCDPFLGVKGTTSSLPTQV